MIENASVLRPREMVCALSFTIIPDKTHVRIDLKLSDNVEPKFRVTVAYPNQVKHRKNYIIGPDIKSGPLARDQILIEI